MRGASSTRRSPPSPKRAKAAPPPSAHGALMVEAEVAIPLAARVRLVAPAPGDAPVKTVDEQRGQDQAGAGEAACDASSFDSL